MSKYGMGLKTGLAGVIVLVGVGSLVQAQDQAGRRRIVELTDGKSPGSVSNRAGISQTPGCDQEAFEAAKAGFQRLRELRQRDLHAVSQAEFQDASMQYISWAESCYQERYGDSAESGMEIDQGGLWSPGYGPGRFRHNLFGTKWGADSPFLSLGDNPDAEGPGSPGGTVTYSFMSNGVSMTSEDAGSNPSGDPNTAISSLATFSDCFYAQIEEAFAAWAAVANIQFLPVVDNGQAFNAPGASGDIRIGAHAIDGASGILAHGYYPPPNGTSAAGDLHFDEAEAWSCNPFPGGIDIGMVALHEIGHAIGLGHESVDTALMAPSYNPAINLTGLLADDVRGATGIYGANPYKRSFFADIGLGTEDPEKQLHIKGYSDAAVAGNNTMVRVQNASSIVETRRMLELINNGVPLLVYKNTDDGATWSMSPQGTGFSISKGGTGATEMFLGQGGDLKIAGDLTANGVFYASDLSQKRDIETLDGQEVLQKVLALPLSTWSFKSDRTSSRHAGPMAQDFYLAFGLGRDSRHISASDISGVALAAVKGLYGYFNEQLARRNTELDWIRGESERKLAAQAARIESLEMELKRMSILESRLAQIDDLLKGNQTQNASEATD